MKRAAIALLAALMLAGTASVAVAAPADAVVGYQKK